MSTTTQQHCLPDMLAVTSWPRLADGWSLTEDGITAAGVAARQLPVEHLGALLDFASHGSDSGALIVRGVPVGELPPTPPSPLAVTKASVDSEFALMMVARLLGQPVGYAPEHGGDLIQNIVPTPTAADRQVSTSSKVELMFHTEAAFHPHRPRYLLLLCLRGDPAAHTTLASIHELRRLLDERTLGVLAEPRFRTATDESYLHGRSNQLGEPMSVLRGDPRRPDMVFDADLMVGVDAEADEAIQTLAGAIERCHTSVALEAGDLLIVDNNVAVHGRTPYQPRFDGTDRWLQRTFVVSDLAPSAGERRGRVITTQFGS